MRMYCLTSDVVIDIREKYQIGVVSQQKSDFGGDSIKSRRHSTTSHKKLFYLSAFEMTDSFGLKAKPTFVVAIDCRNIASIA